MEDVVKLVCDKLGVKNFSEFGLYLHTDKATSGILQTASK